MVAVCSYCKSLSARTDRDPRLIGKMADLVDTGSLLALGAEGRFAGRRFQMVGRTQMKHPMGGVWDEWYLALDDGRWGWLAEAQGRLYLTFQQALKMAVPGVEMLSPGLDLDLGEQGRWQVVEVSRGTFASAEGEIPWEVALGGQYPFADLAGANGAFATLDYGEEAPLFFTGRQTTLEELKIQAPPPVAAAPRLKVQGLPCPRCASPLELRAPDQTQRVTCPSCGSLLDASEGRLTYLKSLQQPHVRMFIPLGAEGRLRGVPLVCVGHLLRSCTLEGVRYPWSEYLMMDPKGGFFWLIESDGHWSFAEPVAPGEIRFPQAHQRTVQLQGETYRRFQDVPAVVEGVWGEFYWRVAQGETAQVAEFVKAPVSLSMEVQAQPGGGSEVNWTRSDYMEGAEIWQAFKLQGQPPTPTGVASHQPNPHWKKAWELGMWMVAALALILGITFWETVTHRETLLYRETFNLQERVPSAPGALPEPELVFFSQPIQITDSRKNLEVKLTAPVNNSWIGVEGALVNESTGLVELFEVSSSYYHGSDSDGPWTEGSPVGTVYLSALPAGTYVLRLAPSWESKQAPVRAMTVELRSGIVRWAYVLLAFLAALLVPVFQVIRAFSFESRRWAESMYSSQNAGED